MKIKTETDNPFTVEQLKALTAEQRQAIEAVAAYLSDISLEENEPTDEDLNITLGLMRSCDGCVPSEYANDDLLNSIRKKFGAVYQVGMELAEAELNAKKITGFNFCLVMDPIYEDATHVAILDYDRPFTYLHEWQKAWCMGFTALADLANAVLEVKNSLVEKVKGFTAKEIYVVMEGGIVHEIVNLPPNIGVTVVDYDTEDAEKEDVQISPLDGELCVIKKW